MDPVAAQILNIEPRRMAMQQALAQQQAQQRAQAARQQAGGVLYGMFPPQQPGTPQGGAMPPPPGVVSPGGGPQQQPPQMPQQGGGMPPPPAGAMMTGAGGIPNLAQQAGAQQARTAPMPPFKPMPSAPPAAAGPGQVPPPPMPTAPAADAPGARQFDLRSIVGTLKNAGVPPEKALDMLDALTPAMTAENKQELDFFKAQNTALKAANEIYVKTLNAATASRRVDVAETAEERKGDQGQQRIDLAKQKLAKQAGGEGNIVKWETDDSGNVVGGFTRSGKHIKLAEPGSAKTSIPGFDEKDVAYWTEVLQKGGSLPPRLATTPGGKKLLQQVMHGTATGKVSPSEMLSNQAQFQGEKAGQRTLGTRTANIEMAGTEADKLADLAQSASAKTARTGMKSLNSAIQAVEKGTASPELRAFVAANTSFINAYARAINPQGVGTVADKEHAREMLDTAFSKGDYTAVIEQLKQEIEAARASPDVVKKSMRDRFVGGSPAAPRQTATNPTTGAQVELVDGKWQPVKK